MDSRRRQHTVLATTFAAGLATLPIVARRRDQLGCDTPFDWARLALATYAASRVVAREKVGSFIREPLLEQAATSAEDLESVRRDNTSLPPGAEGLSATIAELVTCTRCVGVWNAAMLTALRALAPAHGKVVVDVLSVAGANNFLQAAFTRLTADANRAEHEAERAEHEAERLEHQAERVEHQAERVEHDIERADQEAKRALEAAEHPGAPNSRPGTGPNRRGNPLTSPVH